MNIKCYPRINEKAHSKNAKTPVSMVEGLSLSVATDEVEAISGCLSLIVGAGLVSEFKGVHRKEAKDGVCINGKEEDMDDEIEQGD